jgi:hypothetical protein
VSEVPLEGISQLVGHVSTSVAETVYRHEIRPTLAKGAAAMDVIFYRRESASASSTRVGSRRSKEDPGPEVRNLSDLRLLVETAGFEPATP